MYKKLLFVCIAVCLITVAATERKLHAQLLPIAEVINGDPATVEHFIIGGMADAFDGYGAVFGFEDLEITRQVNTLQEIHAYRFLDIFTNNTDRQIDTTAFVFGNLGSDSNTFIVEDGPFQSLTFQDVFKPFASPVGDFDAVIAFTTGNNAFTEQFAFGDVFTNGFMFSFDLSVAPTESVGIMHFATLIKDETDRSLDLSIAESFSDSLLDSPYTVGLTPNQVLSIANFDVVLRGDINCDGAVDLMDVQPFVDAVLFGEFNEKADTNQDGSVDLLDVEWFVFALTN